MLWSDLPRRLATVSIGFPLVWFLFSVPELALLSFLVIQIVCSYEFAQMNPSSGKSSWIKGLFVLCSIALTLGTMTDDSLFLVGLWSVSALFCLMSPSTWWSIGILLITIPFRTWLVLCQDFATTISILLTVWNCDTGALVAGRLSKQLIPNHRLPIPQWVLRLSPAKSSEGFLGGILGGFLTSYYIMPFLMEFFQVPLSEPYYEIWIDAPPSTRILLGVALSAAAIVGDLVESAVKRKSKVKDSGKLLPGQGGLLDRFDSSLLSVLVYVYVFQR